MVSGSAQVTGILLAGGKSSRMGEEKGGLGAEGRTLSDIALSLLEMTCDRIMISTCKEETRTGKYPAICDEIRGIGPMGGVYTCLMHSKTDRNLVLSYDMPLVNAELIHALLDEGDKADLVVPALEGKPPEPLCALYKKGVAASLQHLIKQGNYAMHSVYSLVRTKILAVTPDLSYYHPELFFNINAPEDLQRFRSILESDGGY